MTKLSELKSAFEAATPGEWEANGFGICSLGTPLTKRADVATVTGSGLTDEYAHHTAQFIALAHNNMAALLEAVERLETMQRVIGELASMNPFLRDVFDTNKAVLEKLK